MAQCNLQMSNGKPNICLWLICIHDRICFLEFSFGDIGQRSFLWICLLKSPGNSVSGEMIIETLGEKALFINCVHNYSILN